MTDLPNEEGRAPVGDAAVQAVTEERLDQKPRDDHAAARAHLAPLFEAGMELISLNAPDALDRKGRAVGKAPLRPGWCRADPLDLDGAVEHMVGGCNVGVRLRATDLVVDADPRNYADGDDALARLVADFGLSTHPRVVTGGGGSHIYLTKPAGVLVVEMLETTQASSSRRSAGRLSRQDRSTPRRARPTGLSSALWTTRSPQRPRRNWSRC